MDKVRIMENDRIKLEISDHGAELSWVYDKKFQREILWDGNPEHWNRHAPVLFPFVGSLHNGEYLLNRIKYPMKAHGFGRDSEFEFAGAENNTVTHILNSTKETRKIYPYDFRLEVRHTLVKNKIIAGWKLINKNKGDMLFSIGAHPAFRVPADRDTEQKDYYLTFGDKTILDYIQINEESGTAIDKEVYQLKLTSGDYKLGEHLFDKGVLIFEDNQVETIGIKFPDGENYVTINCKGFPYTGVWTKPKAPFVCLEPWFGRCDNENFEGELKDKAGVQTLKENSIFEANYTIKIH